jgi:hypothetical protein
MVSRPKHCWRGTLAPPPRREGAHLHEVGELGVARGDQPVHLVLDLALLRLLDRDVPLGEARFALSVLKQEEPDLQ